MDWTEGNEGNLSWGGVAITFESGEDGDS
jgi:hypothetical protein